MTLSFADPSAPSLPLHVIEQDALEDWLAEQSANVATWVKAAGFTGGLGQSVLVPDGNGAPAMALAGYGTEAARKRGRFHLAAQAANLPEGVYRLEGLEQGRAAEGSLGGLAHLRGGGRRAGGDGERLRRGGVRGAGRHGGLADHEEMSGMPAPAGRCTAGPGVDHSLQSTPLGWRICNSPP